jgi:hypothetical protein
VQISQFLESIEKSSTLRLIRQPNLNGVILMIHHLSIDARNPLRVASTLAEILSGKAYQFLIPNSYTVMPFDKYGTAIVVFQKGDVWVQDIDEKPARVIQSISPDLVAVHAAISVPISQQRIEEIARREGWHVLTRKQGDAPFSVVEFWVENRILFEFLPPEFEAQYLQSMQPNVLEPILGHPIQLLPV